MKTLNSLGETMTRLLIIALAACIQLDCGEAHAGGYYRSYVQKVYAQPIVVYQVGIGVQTDAIVQAQLRSHPTYGLAQKLEERMANDPAFLDRLLNALEDGVPQGALGQQQSFIGASCVRCHSGAEPKAGLDLTLTPYSPALVKAIKDQIMTAAMPPPNSPEAKAMTPETAGGVVSEAIDLLGDPQPPAAPQAIQQPPAAAQQAPAAAPWDPGAVPPPPPQPPGGAP